MFFDITRMAAMSTGGKTKFHQVIKLSMTQVQSWSECVCVCVCERETEVKKTQISR